MLASTQAGLCRAFGPPEPCVKLKRKCSKAAMHLPEPFDSHLGRSQYSILPAPRSGLKMARAYCPDALPFVFEGSLEPPGVGVGAAHTLYAGNDSDLSW